MRFVDQLFMLYKNNLTGDEEDALLIVSSVLSELNVEQMIDLIRDMSHDEVYEMLGTFLVDRLNRKMVQEGAIVPDAPVHTDQVH